MKIAVLIPDRGDRPKFLENCLRMMSEQELKPDHIEIVNDEPLSAECDITWRYRIGYDRLRNRGFDVIALIENDDWYCPMYLKYMVEKWIDHGKPNIFGTSYTIYYHLRSRAYYMMHHVTRASAMNTLIVPDLNFPWCADSEPYTDIHLWNHLTGFTHKPLFPISIGIKHGEGLCGGEMHTNRLERFNLSGIKDPDYKFLKGIMNENSYEFYSNYFK
jgi:hypothetical protein